MPLVGRVFFPEEKARKAQEASAQELRDAQQEEKRLAEEANGCVSFVGSSEVVYLSYLYFFFSARCYLVFVVCLLFFFVGKHVVFLVFLFHCFQPWVCQDLLGCSEGS